VTPPPQAEMTAGAALYAHACIACHEADGSGAPRIYPPLPGNANLQSADPSSTLRIILDGAQTVTTPRAPNSGSMPAYAKQLSDQQIADVTNYIRNSWGNAAPPGNARAGQESAADINVIPGHILRRVPSDSTQKIVRIGNPKLLAAVVFLLTEEPIHGLRTHPDDPYRPNLADDEYRRQARLDNELRPIPNSQRVRPVAPRSRCSPSLSRWCLARFSTA